MVTTQFWAGAGNCLTPITPKFVWFSSGSPNLKIVKILLPTGILGRGDNMRKIHLKNSFSMAPHWWHAAHHHIPQLFVARIRLRSRSWGVEWDGWNHLKNHLFTKQLATSNFIAGYICPPYIQNSFPPGNRAMSSPKGLKESRSSKTFFTLSSRFCLPSKGMITYPTLGKWKIIIKSSLRIRFSNSKNNVHF